MGGLCAGAILSRRGLKVCVLEKHHQAGGYASHFKRGAFEFDVSLHQIGGVHITFLKNILAESGIEGRLQFIKHKFLYEAVSPDDELAVPNGDVEGLKQELYRRFPREKLGIRLWFFLLWKIGREVFWWDRAVRSRIFLPVLFYFAPLAIPLLVFSHKIPLQRVINLCTRSAGLQSILMQLLNYYGGSMDIAAQVPLIASYGYYFDGGYYIRGGSKAVTTAFIKTIRENGGDIFTSSEVVGIDTENNRATGIRTKKGQLFHARNIIVNASPFTLYEKLLSAWPGSAGELEKINRMAIGPSLSNLYLGLDATIAELNPRFAHSYLLFLRDDSGRTKYSLAFHSNIESSFCPQGKSVLSVTFPDDYAAWAKLTDTQYREAKQKKTDAILTDLDKYLPGIRNRVAVAEFATPLTMERYTGNKMGAVYGFAQNIGQAGFDRFNNKSPVKNLLFASAWTAPGGGFEGAMRAGYRAANRIKR